MRKVWIDLFLGKECSFSLPVGALSEQNVMQRRFMMVIAEERVKEWLDGDDGKSPDFGLIIDENSDAVQQINQIKRKKQAGSWQPEAILLQKANYL